MEPSLPDHLVYALCSGAMPVACRWFSARPRSHLSTGESPMSALRSSHASVGHYRPPILVWLACHGPVHRWPRAGFKARVHIAIFSVSFRISNELFKLILISFKF
jgi:hypothetical protein